MAKRIQQQRVHDIESCGILPTEWPETELVANSFTRRKNKTVSVCRQGMKIYLFNHVHNMIMLSPQK